MYINIHYRYRKFMYVYIYIFIVYIIYIIHCIVISRTCGCLAWLISMVQLPHEQVQDQGVLVVPKGCAAPEGGLVSGRIRWSPFDSLVDCCG